MNSRRNVVLVTADSVRADYCGFLNPEVNTTPWMEEMAGTSLSFTNAISPGPRTPSSIPEIMTGEGMPNDHVDPTDWKQRIARIGEHMSTAGTLAEGLRDEGYRTIAFSSNPWTGTYSRFDTGFDVFEKTGKRHMRNFNVFADTPFEPLSRTFDQWWNGLIWRPINGIGAFARWPHFFDDIVASVDSSKDPYFLWVFLLDTHSPYLVPRRDRRESSLWQMFVTQFRANSVFKDTGTGETSAYRNALRPKTIDRLQRLYRDSIRSVDAFLASLWDTLEPDDPLLLFHSDHGEAFDDHGTFGHQRELYEENVHVPLYVFNSGSAGTVKEVVSLRDLSPMIRRYVTEDVPFTDPRWHSGRAILRTEDNSKFGIRTERWKYILHDEDDSLYDLDEDPAEMDDVVAEFPSVTETLREDLEAYIEGLPRGSEYLTRAIDTETETRLADLGYIE